MKREKPSLVLLLSLGILIGAGAFLSISIFLVFFSVLFIIFFLKNLLPQEDRSFILKIVFIAFILRMVFVIFYYGFFLSQGNLDILGPDGEVYSQRGWYISRLLLDQNPYVLPNSGEAVFSDYNVVVRFYKQKLPPLGMYQTGINTYVIGILYAIFGYVPLMMKLINSAFSVFTGVMIYFIGKEIFNPKIGKISMTLVIFLPSIFIYSITALKDTIVIFLLTAIIWLMMKFQKSKNLLWLILPLVAAVILRDLRKPIIIYPLLMLIASILLLSLRIGILKKCFIIILASIVLLSIPPVVKIIKTNLHPDKLFSIHIGYINTPGNNYKIFPDRCYYGSQLVGIGPKEITGAFVKGIFHLLYEPLPYRVNNITLLFAFPQTFLLYLFMPFVVGGLIIGLRHRSYQMIPLAMYLIIFIPLMAISSGNVGTVFRHRDMLMPFLIILGTAGCYAMLRRNNSPLLK